MWEQSLCSMGKSTLPTANLQRLFGGNMRVRVGSLVKWSKKGSEDYGCVGIVTHVLDSVLLEYYYFTVDWADNTLTEYGADEIEDGNIEVVKF